ncbi:MAG: hypothetical protein F4Y78_01985 [Candidatus Dadabacteria bacterium]|nr:hypothetical protein [Candidatus Dadabacteria bacterium]MYA47653.1 hypothetical protein [Candidatus Dadabacteria bacterium]MYF48390.1 hypothetical protein [Candidatus Dadabacteria bacterium]MYK49753.1 hypothetical protein [Candidatus Dadabacteria bacterium]
MTNLTWLWKEYEFIIYDPSHACEQETGGVYIFSGQDRQGIWRALYIGETWRFSDRLPGHEKWPSAVALGATHIHLKVFYTEAMRKSVEKELIDYYKPPLND